METKFSFDHILCPTDFSETAGVALEHATLLAEKFNAKLSILNVREAFAEFMILKEYGIPGREDKDYFNHVNAKFEKLTAPIKARGIRVETFCTSGKIADEVSKFAKDNNVSDVVIGMHGVRGRDSYFMGGNAHKIVNSTKVPVLQVDKHAHTNDYKLILMPIDSSFHTREKIPYATSLAKKYGAEIRLIALQTSSNDEIRQNVLKVLNQVEKYIVDNGVKVDSSVRNSNNLSDDTLEYADEINADLIIIMSEQEKTLRGLFLGSYAQQLVNQSTRPVLTIPPKIHMVMSDVNV